MSLRNDLRKLDPAVVERAITYIEERYEVYSCHALNRAVGWLNCKNSHDYRWAYERCTSFLRLIRPVWWDNYCDKNGHGYEQERIQALTTFRDAILKAKKPTLLERLKVWLAEPSNYADFS